MELAEAAQRAAAATELLSAVMWRGFISLPEGERDRLDPEWREHYFEYLAYREKKRCAKVIPFRRREDRTGTNMAIVPPGSRLR